MKRRDFLKGATLDDRHYEPCMMALELGYDVLLEKPAAPTKKECPYDAVEIYTHLKQHTGVFDLEGNKDSAFILSRTRIMGTMGYIEGDGKSFVLTYFLTRTPKLWNHEVAEIGEDPRLA